MASALTWPGLPAAGWLLLAWPPVQTASALAQVPPAQLPLAVVARDWLPVGAVALALPTPSPRAPAEEAAARVADLALLATLREAAGGLAARVGLTHTRTGRHFVATAAPEDLPEVLRVMRQVASHPLPLRHVEAALARFAREREFRQGSPQDRFEQLFSAHLADAQADDGAETPAAPAPLVVPAAALPKPSNGLPETLAAKATAPPETAWGSSAWVVVADSARARLLDRLPSPAEPAQPFVLPSSRPSSPAQAPSLSNPSAPPRIATVREPAEAVTTWVGLAYGLAPGATLAQAELLRALLVAHLERQRYDALYALSAEVGPGGRLLVQFSAAPEAARDWESRIDEALASIAAEGPSGSEGLERELAGLLRAVRGARSRMMSHPAHPARTAADALLRGATRQQALSLARNADPPGVEEAALAARGLRLEARVEYGAAAR